MALQSRYKAFAVLLLGSGIGIAGVTWWQHRQSVLVQTTSTPSSAATCSALSYPCTPRGEEVSQYHGVQVPDPYRWLEKTSPERAAWREAQEKLTAAYWENLPKVKILQAQYDALCRQPILYDMTPAGESIVLLQAAVRGSSAGIYLKSNLQEAPRQLVSPLQEVNTCLRLLSASPQGRYLAYTRSSGAKTQLCFFDLVGNKPILDDLPWAVDTPIAWDKRGIYYVMAAPEEDDTQAVSVLPPQLATTGATRAICYHHMGSPQHRDTIVYLLRPSASQKQHGVPTLDGKYFIRYVKQADGRTATYYKAIQQIKQASTSPNVGWRLLGKPSGRAHRVIDHHAGKLIVHTRLYAPNGRVVTVDIQQPDAAYWQTLIPATACKLQKVTAGGGKLFAHYQADVGHRCVQFDYDGTHKHVLDLPSFGTCQGLLAAPQVQKLWGKFTATTRPERLFQYEPESKAIIFEKSETNSIPTQAYVERVVTYMGHEDTPITMLLIHRKGLVLDGSQPACILGNVDEDKRRLPYFKPEEWLFLSRGGVLAIPNLRDSGPAGSRWDRINSKSVHKFERMVADCVGAANYLIDQGYTCPPKLALSSMGSGGGIFVNMCISKHPELFTAAVSQSECTDLLRLSTLIADGSSYELRYKRLKEIYGAPDTKYSFQRLYAYSPLHQAYETKLWPATLLLLPSCDKESIREEAIHGYKWGAQLQALYPDRTVLLYDGFSSSAYPSTPVARWAFIWHHISGTIPNTIGGAKKQGH